MSKVVIDSFEGEYRFLSNFSYEGGVKPTVEHHYQATKTHSKTQQAQIMMAKTPGIAKKLGRKVTLCEDWEKIKTEVMLSLLLQKFAEPEIQEKLLATGDAALIEGNWWGDTYWGVCNGEGENWLGQILMIVRDCYREL
jgi:N-glycosidase YbiA